MPSSAAWEAGAQFGIAPGEVEAQREPGERGGVMVPKR